MVGVVFSELHVTVDRDLCDLAVIALVVVEESVPQIPLGDQLDIREAGILEHRPGGVVVLVVQVAG